MFLGFLFAVFLLLVVTFQTKDATQTKQMVLSMFHVTARVG